MAFHAEGQKRWIHTVNNTDIENIKKNCELHNLTNNDNNCVLIITGSLNPIHRSHIKNLRIVKNYLENHKSQPLNVLAAYLSPSHDSYVRSKLGRLDWISAEDRCKLCNEVIEYEQVKSWISVAEGEYQCNGFVDFDQVSISLAEFLNFELYESNKFLQHPLKVVYVCGLDHFNKCPYVIDLARAKNIACAVIYRLGAPDDNIKRLEENLSNIYYITLEDERNALVDISSTEIRKRFRNPNNTNLDELTYPCISEFLKTKYSTI